MTPADNRALDDATGELERTWAEKPGVVGWLSNVDHKAIGRRYLVTAFAYFLLAGLLAALMRLQLSRPGNTLLSADTYNQVFTTHGATMMFLFAVPVMQGLAVYFVPLMVGARAIAFPRLVAYSYWMLLFGGIFLYVSLLLNAGPDVGWFSYPPLSEALYTPSRRADVWAQLITFTEVASLSVAVSTVTTVLKMRTPGMSLNRIPLFVWAELVVAFMVIFAMPAVMLASTMLILDRLVLTHFFDPRQGGDPILFQHVFWIFGHPEVYIIFLPGTGIISTVVSTFSGRPLFGYLAVVLSLVTTAFLSFSLWVHHMFATGLPQLGESFFTAASIAIAVPTGIQVFCWIATLWRGRVRFATPMLWVIGFFVVFIAGGLTGVMLASVPFNTQVHDTFFVVAHFHYVLIGGAVFPLFGGIYYWFPKLAGRMLSARAGAWVFGLMFAGFNMTFFPMHILGLYGMPRRVYTYQAGLGWDGMNLLASIGAMTMAAAVTVFAIDVLRALRSDERAPANPWGAATLEWATASPPYNSNFPYQPTVAGRDPLWDNPPDQPVVTGLRTDVRDVLVTHPVDASPDHRTEFPSPSIWPFLTALATTALFVGSIFTPRAVLWGSVPLFITMVGWFWPKKPGEGGTPEWPIGRRTLPLPGEG